MNKEQERARFLTRLNHSYRNQYRKSEFSGRQISLVATAAWWIVMWTLTGWTGLLALSVLFLTLSRDECLRFKTTGRYWQTRRSMWTGSTPHDEANRRLAGRLIE